MSGLQQNYGHSAVLEGVESVSTHELVASAEKSSEVKFLGGMHP